MIDNIIIGTPIVPLSDLGITEDEETICLPLEESKRNFLPAILVAIGLFKSTSQIRQINKQRMKSDNIKDDRSRNLWRTCNELEFTYFKIGKKVFWLIVGE